MNEQCSPDCEDCSGTGEVLIAHANNDGGFISDEEYGTCPRLLEDDADLINALEEDANQQE